MQPGQTIVPEGAEQPSDNSEMLAENAGKEVSVGIAHDSPSSLSVSSGLSTQSESQTVATGYDPKPSTPASLGEYNQTGGTLPSGLISWTASEYIAHQKSTSWYLMLGGVSVGVAATVFLFTKDKISTAMVVLVAVIFGVTAARKPRTLTYTLNDFGLTVGEKFYGYDLFKSFSVMEDGPLQSIYLLPLRRFMLPITIYYDPNEEDKIATILSRYLPFEERKLDTVDSLMRRIRF